MVDLRRLPPFGPRAVILLPVMNQDWAADTLAALDDAQWSGLRMTVPNYEANIGVPKSWNRGIDALHQFGYEYLILLSEALIPTGFDRFLVDLVEAREQGFAGLEGPHWWHLAGIHRDTLEQVGRFDEGFFPAYYEDADYHYRMKLAGLEMKYIDQPYGTDRGTAHCLTQGLVKMDYGKVTARYVAKWGGEPGRERYTVPFNGRPE